MKLLDFSPRQPAKNSSSSPTRTAVSLYYATVYRSQDGNEGLRLDYKGREGCHKQIPSMCMANTIHLRPNNTGKLVSTEIQWWWCFVGPPNTHTSDILTRQSLMIVSKKAKMKLKLPNKDWSWRRFIDEDVFVGSSNTNTSDILMKQNHMKVKKVKEKL